MRILQFFSSVSLLLISSLSWSEDPVLGQWNTIDDETGEIAGLVTLSLSDNGILSGVISKVLVEREGGGLCVKCEGERKDQLIEGMEFMWGFKQVEEGKWTEGKLLDPNSGDIYSGNITISEDLSELDVRGYIGISLFGRSQTWIKVVEK